MYPVFETLQVLDGQVLHFELHEARMKKTIHDLWHQEFHFPQLKFEIEALSKKGKQKCRVLYNQFKYNIECQNYTRKKIDKLHLLIDDSIEYKYKYTDRSSLIAHLQLFEQHDEILIIKNNRITDTSYSNVALWNGHEWHTPLYPLFYGIQRNHLIQQGLIKEKDITMNEWYQYKKITLINAMLALGEVEIECSEIIY